MGRDYKCGCRSSGDSWYLCPDHEAQHLAEIMDTEEIIMENE